MRPEDSRTIALCVDAVVHQFSIPQAALFDTGPPNRHSQGKAPLDLIKRRSLFNPRKDAEHRIRIWVAQPAQLDSSESTDLGTRQPVSIGVGPHDSVCHSRGLRCQPLTRDRQSE
jgi:hypothetical protein